MKKMILNKTLINLESIKNELDIIENKLKVTDSLFSKLKKYEDEIITVKYLKENLTNEEFEFINGDIEEDDNDFVVEDFIKFFQSKKEFISDYLKRTITPYENILEIVDKNVITVLDFVNINSEIQDIYDYFYDFTHQYNEDEYYTLPFYYVFDLTEELEIAVKELQDSYKNEVGEIIVNID